MYLHRPITGRSRPQMHVDRGTAWNPTIETRTIAGVKQRRGSGSIRVALGIALESTIIVWNRQQEASPASRSRQTLFPWREGPTSLGAVSIIWWRIEIEGSAGCSEHSWNLEHTDVLPIDPLFIAPPSWLASRSQVLDHQSEVWKLGKGRSRTSRRWTVGPWNYILGIWKCEVNAYWTGRIARLRREFQADWHPARYTGGPLARDVKIASQSLGALPPRGGGGNDKGLFANWNLHIAAPNFHSCCEYRFLRYDAREWCNDMRP